MKKVYLVALALFLSGCATVGQGAPRPAVNHCPEAVIEVRPALMQNFGPKKNDRGGPHGSAVESIFGRVA